MRIVEADDRLATELALVENLQREDLNPMEEANGYRKLMEEYGLTQEQAARRVQKSRPAVANALRLLSLCPAVQSLVSDGSLSAGHARALASLKEPDRQSRAAQEVIERGLSVRQTEKLAASLLRGEKERPEKDRESVDYAREAERRLSDALGRAVRLTGGNMEKPWKEMTEGENSHA